jgi:serine/threonine protein kinase
MLASQNGPFSETEVVRWADQLCDALDYLHTQDPQIIHRDIKPQNLKMTARGQVVLLDFGLAKGSAGQLTAVTTSASIFGYTPNYAPLEQVQGKGTDARSDIYALGSTLYHLVTNVKPPDALSRAAAMVNGQPDPLLPANEIRPEIGIGLANVLGRAMSQKRDDRFTTADDMRRALGFGQSGSLSEETLVTASAPASAAAPTVTSSERATRLVGDQTRRTTSPSLSSEAQTLVAGEATSVRTVTTGQGAVAPPARNNFKPLAAAVVVLIVAAAGLAGLFGYRRQQAQQSGTLPAEPQTQSQTQSSQPSEPLNSSVGPASASKDTSETGKTSQAKTDKSKPETPKTETQRSAPATPEVKAQDPFKNLPPPEVFDPAHQADPNRGRERNPRPGQPPFDPMRPPEDRRMRPTLTVPEVRVLPNGGRLIRQPDGSVIMISPKGETKIIPAPGQRPKGKGNTNGNDNQSP